MHDKPNLPDTNVNFVSVSGNSKFQVAYCQLDKLPGPV